MISCENKLQSHMDTVTMTKPNCVHPTTQLAWERSSLAPLVVQTGAGPAWNLMKNSDWSGWRCEQKTVTRTGIWKERVNYKQQGLSTICSILNDVILTLKLPETHLLGCILLCELSPALWMCQQPLYISPVFSLPLPQEPLQLLAKADFPATTLKDHSCKII